MSWENIAISLYERLSDIEQLIKIVPNLDTLKKLILDKTKERYNYMEINRLGFYKIKEKKNG